MPKWKPAESANGMKVKQEFEFSVGNKVSGCQENQALGPPLGVRGTSMPKWKPAESADGMKVKQEFEFSVGNKVSVC